MGQNNSLEISYDEWRSFFLVNPANLESVTGDPNEMLRYWRGATVYYFHLIEKFFLFFFFSISI
jgi:hypothetical protein